MKKLLTLSLFVLAAAVPIKALAATSAEYSLVPLSLSQETTPLVMLAMSNDHQLYFKAYPDFTDLDGDGVLNIRYTDDFSYSGYFNPDLCYQYSTTNNRFEVLPASDVLGPRPDKNTAKTINYSCFSGWSGNFLNWASMTRMDLLRHVLYGGKRSIDDITTSSTTTFSDGTVINHGSAVLERAYLPNDVHSFGKLKPEWHATDNPDEVSLYHLVPDAYVSPDGVTFCSTSTSTTNPVLRAAKGLWPGWSMNAGTVCNYGDGGSPTTASQINNDLVVRVEVCKDPQEWNSSRCRLYLDGEDQFYKPAGLIQKFGEDGRIDLGLITGSYVNNTDGGIIRSPIKRFAGNENASEDEVDLSNGSFQTISNGIVNNLDAFRIYGWRGAGYSDNCAGAGILIDELLNDGRPWDKQCADWGNPVGEILYETIRYFSGNDLPRYAGSRTRNGITRSEEDFLSSLSTVTNWTNPLNADNYCATCATILISSGPTSFDNDVVTVMNGDVIGLSTRSDLESKTDAVGDIEYGTFSGKTFIANENNLCVEKTVGDLSDENGVCPDAPSLRGSYHTAGIAYHANTTDLFDDTEFAGEQTVRTYAIDLADAVPELDFTVNGSPVKIVPACNAGPNGAYQYCSLTDIQLSELQLNDSGDLIYARMHIAWEDSNWGSDFDLDLVQRVDIYSNLYSVDGDGDQLCGVAALANGEFCISSQIVNWAGGFYMRATYSVSGSTQDGLQEIWSIKTTQGDVDNGIYDWRTGTDPVRISQRYTVDTLGSVAQSLKKPLYLAAKYGGFVDTNGNNEPDLAEEWDTVVNETGAFGSDGIPDNYYKVRNPATLEEQLSQVFNSIVERVSSGSNAAVVANRATGNGSVYQALYYPKLSQDSSSVSWVGQLNSLFVDRAGFIREDTDGDDILDDYPVYVSSGTATDGDFIVEIFYDENRNGTFFQRYVLLGATGDAAKIAIPHQTPLPLDEINTIWSGADSLAIYTNEEVVIQRNYDADADTGRYIFTSTLDTCDLELCETERSFDINSVSVLSGYLGFANDTDGNVQAQRLIQFTRGRDQAGMRSRQFDVDGDGDLETWRLGDIVHSTPLVVEKTLGRFDQTLGDDTYKAFRQLYDDRRRMVYVGSNSGMIHAFNGGYWDSNCLGFFNQPITGSGIDGTVDPLTDCTNSSSGHPVGAEIWAYVPRAVLPHLKWKAELDYGHVYTVDGEPQAYDVRIFEDDIDHPDGWGTILVVPMRQGGLDITVDHDNDSATDDRTLRSSIIVLDITNPEEPPELIAEISDPNMGLTIGKPTLINDYKPSTTGSYDSPSQNDWYLVFGSGPYPALSGSASVSTSSQAGTIYAYNLKEKALTKRALDDVAVASMYAPNSFLAGFESADWDGNGTTDAVYFGSVSGNVANQTGKLFRWQLDEDIDIKEASDLSPSVMLDTEQPIVAAPIVSRDFEGDRWVHFGTGRFFVLDDRDTEGQQNVYGIKEPKTTSSFSWGEVSKAGLLNSNAIKVLDDGSIKTESGGDVVSKVDASIVVADYDALQFEMTNYSGWYRDLTQSSNEPSGRLLREPLLFQDQLVFSEYLPSADQCDVNGRSLLSVVSWKTGTAIPYSPLGEFTSEDLDGDGTDENVVSTTVDLGVGEFSGVNVFETSSNVQLIDDASIIASLISDPANATSYVESGTGNCVFVQSSTGAMVCYRTTVGAVDAAGRQSWRELEILF